jgi:hypothetical protein
VTRVLDIADPARGEEAGELGGDRLVLLVHLGEHSVQVVVGEHAARVLAEVATPLRL